MQDSPLDRQLHHCMALNPTEPRPSLKEDNCTAFALDTKQPFHGLRLGVRSMRQDFASHRSFGSKQYARSCEAMYEHAARNAGSQQAPNAADATRPSCNMVCAPPQNALAGTCVQRGAGEASHRPARVHLQRCQPPWRADTRDTSTIAERCRTSSPPSPHRSRQRSDPHRARPEPARPARRPAPRRQRADPRRCHRPATSRRRTRRPRRRRPWRPRARG